MELASKYNPADVEGKWYQYWLDNKLFSSITVCSLFAGIERFDLISSFGFREVQTS